MTATFKIVAPDSINGEAGHRTLAIFKVHSEAELLAALQERLSGMKQDHALVALDAPALTMVLRAGLPTTAERFADATDDRCHGECGLHAGVLR